MAEDAEELVQAEVPQDDVDDWLQCVDKLPDRAPSVIEQKYVQLFAMDVHNVRGHDLYVYIVPNGLCILGLAPSHRFIKAYREGATQQGHAAGHAAAAVSGQQAQAGSTAVEAEPGAGQIADTEPQDAQPEQPGSGVKEGQDTDMAEIDGQGTEAPRKQEPEQQAAEGSATAAASPKGQQGQQQSKQAGQQGSRKRRASQQGGPGEAEAAAQASPKGAQAGEGASPTDSKQPKEKDKDKELVKELKQVMHFDPSLLARVNFDVGRRNSSVKQSGKKRGQGNMLEASSVLCRLESSDANIPVRAVVPGKLLEVNTRLLDRPQLLLERPCREGYLAIVFPNDAQLAALKTNLASKEQYLQARGLTPEALL